jgi:hypothetical protein
LLVVRALSAAKRTFSILDEPSSGWARSKGVRAIRNKAERKYFIDGGRLMIVGAKRTYAARKTPAGWYRV